MHRALLVAIVALAMIWPLGSALWAAAPREGANPGAVQKDAGANQQDDGQAAQGHQGEEGGFFGWSLDLFIWTMVVFLILLFVLGRYAWPQMLDALDKREETIRSSVVEAQLARAETERVRAQFKAEMDQAFAKIPLLMDEARKNGEKLAAEMRAKAAAEIQGERDRGKRELESARDRLLQDLTNQTAKLATLISANVLARTLTPEDHTRLFALAVEELKTSGQSIRQDT